MIESLNRNQKRLVNLFALMLIISFSPIKTIGALGPFIFIVGMLFYVKHSQIHHIIRYTIFLSLYTGVGFLYFLLYDNFSFGNYFLFLITCSSLLICIYDFKHLITEHVITKLVKVTIIILVFEASFGLIQAIIAYTATGTFDSYTGDFVKGTIEPSFFHNKGTGSNQMFAILISTLLLFMYMVTQNVINKKLLILYSFILCIFVLASVMHLIFFLIIAVISSIIFKNIIGLKINRVLLFSFRWRNSIMYIGMILITAILVNIFLPKNLANLNIYKEHAQDFSSESLSPKIVATYLSINNLPQDEPLQPFIGLGLGQYSSRAGMIRTGKYLSFGSIIPDYTTPYLESYIMPLWHKNSQNPGSRGSTFFPFYSWLSLYGETGWLGIIIVIGLLSIIGRNIILCKSIIFPYMPHGLLILLIYIALLGFQDNYWEWSQAVFPALLILRLGSQYILKGTKIS